MKRNIEELLAADDIQPAQKKTRQSRFEGVEVGNVTGSLHEIMPSSQNIQELLANTKKQIEARKKTTEVLLAQQQLPTAGLLPTPSDSPINVYPIAEHIMSSAMSEAVEKARKAAEVSMLTPNNVFGMLHNIHVIC